MGGKGETSPALQINPGETNPALLQAATVDFEGWWARRDKAFQLWSWGAGSASGVEPGCASSAASGLPVWQGLKFLWFVVVCCYLHIGSCQEFEWWLGEGTSLKLGGGKEPSPWSSATAGSADSAQVDGCGMCCPSQGYKLLLQRGTNPPCSAGAGGWGDKRGFEGQAAHLQVSSFFSCLLCNIELWTFAFLWRWRGALSLLSP